MTIILYSVLVVVLVGLVSAGVLYVVSQKFYVFEDPRIDEVMEFLPAANCGGCGYAGCRAFAEVVVNSEEMGTLFCPVGGNVVMSSVALHLGRSTKDREPLVAVVRCSGSWENRPRTSYYDGTRSCAVLHHLYVGETDCPYGCLGCGDCVDVCDFGAIKMNIATGLPEVDQEKCTACGACVKACPRSIIELRKKGTKGRRIFVSCVNKDKGGIAKKYCSVACTGCAKCFKVCPFEAIHMSHHLAYIDPQKCRLCRKCAPECPTQAIAELNFQPRIIKE